MITKSNIATPLRVPLKNYRNIKNLKNQDKCQPVEVFCRVKPLPFDEESSSFVNISTTSLETVALGGKNGLSKQTRYNFTKVFSENSSQSQIFTDLSLPFIEDFIEGKNALLFTYGVTGSGKTYTMQGNSREPGLVPRTFDVLFNSIGQYQTKKYVFKPDSHNGFCIQSEGTAMMERQRNEQKNLLSTPRREIKVNYLIREQTVISQTDPESVYAVFMSLVEVYNNSVFDLLQDQQPDTYGHLQTLQLREDGRRVYVHGACEVEVKSSEEALKIYLTGQRRRRVAETLLNRESSRSHCVLSLRLLRVPMSNSHGLQALNFSEQVVSQFCMVDLAGSERTGRTNTQGTRLKEASNINNSLMSLRKCLEILRENQTLGCNKVVPYRDQRLTYLFRNFFEGDGRVRILACVNQSQNEYDETLQVLKFAENSQEIQTFRTPLISIRSENTILKCPSEEEIVPDNHNQFSINDVSSSVWPILNQDMPPCGPEFSQQLREFFLQRVEMKENVLRHVVKQYDNFREIMNHSGSDQKLTTETNLVLQHHLNKMSSSKTPGSSTSTNLINSKKLLPQTPGISQCRNKKVVTILSEQWENRSTLTAVNNNINTTATSRKRGLADFADVVDLKKSHITENMSTAQGQAKNNLLLHKTPVKPTFTPDLFKTPSISSLQSTSSRFYKTQAQGVASNNRWKRSAFLPASSTDSLGSLQSLNNIQGPFVTPNKSVSQQRKWKP